MAATGSTRGRDTRARACTTCASAACRWAPRDWPTSSRRSAPLSRAISARTRTAAAAWVTQAASRSTRGARTSRLVIDRPISRRHVLQLAAAAVTTASALPLVADATPAAAATSAQRTTLEAWADTIVPGEKRNRADRAIAGACKGPGAVQAGVWQLMNDPDVGVAPILPVL